VIKTILWFQVWIYCLKAKIPNRQKANLPGQIALGPETFCLTAKCILGTQKIRK